MDDGSAVMFPSSNEIHLKPARNQCVLQSDVLPLELPLLLSGWRITSLEEEQPGAVKMLPPPICTGPGLPWLCLSVICLSRLGLHVTIPDSGLAGLAVPLWESLLAICPLPLS